MKARVERKAEREVVDAALRYESAEPGLGGRFLDAYDRILESIAGFPESHPLFEISIGREYRAALIKPFPFLAVYEMRSGEPVIIAVDHVRRGDRSWRRRVSRDLESRDLEEE